MSEAGSLRAFVANLLEDAGAEVRDDGTFLWVRSPEAIQRSLDLPASACLTFDADRTGEFDAELVAPGGYVLEKLLDLGTRRGRWDVARLAAPPEGWALEALTPLGEVVGPATPAEEVLAVFAFRTALTSDEKREAFRLIAVSASTGEAWEVPWPLAEDGLAPAALPEGVVDLPRAYAAAQAALRHLASADAESFRKACLAALDEEVRRILRYFDGTVKSLREANPKGVEYVVRAIEAERDRRLAEAVERFEPHARAWLCSVRVVMAPAARAVVRSPEGRAVEARVDALTRRARTRP